MHKEIAVCDNDLKTFFLLENYVNNIEKNDNISIDLEFYDSGKSFCDSYERGRFDLVLTEIELSDMNGMNIGEFIRNEMEDYEIDIAFMSVNISYAPVLFKYRPIDFLFKPLTYQSIISLINGLYIEERMKEKKFTYKFRAKTYSVFISQILYLSSEARKILVHKKDGIDVFYGCLDRIYEKLHDCKCFIRIHKSYVVNRDYIEKCERNQVLLCNKELLPVSQSRRTLILKLLHNSLQNSVEKPDNYTQYRY